MAHPDLIAEFEKPRLPFLVDRLSEAVGLPAENSAFVEALKRVLA
jgi:histidinol-phosphate/aromatic aminotransferase/cobyric acid decarboxylase-like protein